MNPEQLKKAGPWVMLGGLAVDATLIALAARFVKNRLVSPPKGKSKMAPLTIIALGLGAAGLVYVAKKDKGLSGLSLDQRFQVAMTAPTSDQQYYAREVAYFRQQGRDDLATQIQLRANALALAAQATGASATRTVSRTASKTAKAR